VRDGQIDTEVVGLSILEKHVIGASGQALAIQAGDIPYLDLLSGLPTSLLDGDAALKERDTSEPDEGIKTAGDNLHRGTQRF
jgi:hypothetical protein